MDEMTALFILVAVLTVLSTASYILSIREDNR